jgi:hypothetical protein
MPQVSSQDQNITSSKFVKQAGMLLPKRAEKPGVNQEQVETLEREIESAIRQVIRRLAKGLDIKRPPGDHICHLMAKAAVAVYEAVADEEKH